MKDKATKKYIIKNNNLYNKNLIDLINLWTNIHWKLKE